jgi:3-phenylpropionate/cinnamic acid dioxygenase small subunit
MTFNITRAQAEDLLFAEARLLDKLELDSWLHLFSEHGLYWIPIDENAPNEVNLSIIYDTPMRRQERVHHILHNTYPAQSPRSRTVHFVSNVTVEQDPRGVKVQSSQLIYEMRTGDSSQVGLGEPAPLVAQVEHVLCEEAGQVKILEKKILLINRDAWHGNLTFLI